MAKRRDRSEQWATFWCSLLGPLFYGDVHPKDAGLFLRRVSEEAHLAPDGKRRRFSRATLWRKWRAFRIGGFQGLLGKRRADAGKSRLPEKVVAFIIELKKDQPHRSAAVLQRIVKMELGRSVPRSTIDRILRQAGATRALLNQSPRKVRRRWSRDYSDCLWVGDFQDGPDILVDGKQHKSHLTAFIDCHSRFIVEARYYPRSNFDVLNDCLLRAWAKHGLSREIYLDNAAVYRDERLKAACGALNIQIRYRPVREPQTGGLIERFFQTSQTQFERELRGRTPIDLVELNQKYAAWLDLVYHQTMHSETQMTPKERYEQAKLFTREISLVDVLPHFFESELRTVDEDFSDVQVRRRFYRVDPRFRGRKLMVRFCPPFFEWVDGAVDAVYLYTTENEPLGLAPLHDRNSPQPQPPRPKQPPKPQPTQYDFLGKLHQQHREQLEADLEQLSRLAPAAPNRLDFIKKAAAALGRAGGIGSFSPDELGQLNAHFDKFGPPASAAWHYAAQKRSTESVVELVVLLAQFQERSA